VMSSPRLQPPEPDPGVSVRPRRRRPRARPLLPFAAGILATILALVIYGAAFPPAPPLGQADVNAAIASALASVTPPPAFSEEAWARIRPALVLVEAGAASPPASPASPAPSGDPAGSLGSGVVIDDRGDIMTALHVVDGARSITVTFADGSTSPAVVSVARPDTDIAVLQPLAPPTSIQPAVLGNPGSVRVGSDAYVVGNPFGLYGSMSAGVVSALGRSFKLANGRTLTGLIQVDAAVNPGNSGGPLLDRDGQVIGIVDALVNPTREDVFVGIGLAVPIDVAGGAAGLPQY
jgi:S1-C subfamily serine protease